MRQSSGPGSDRTLWSLTTGGRIRDTALSHLEARNIVTTDGGPSGGPIHLHDRVRRTRNYRLDDGLQREVGLRIMDALFDDAIPDSRDVVLIFLADACNAFRQILSPSEHAQVGKGPTGESPDAALSY